MRLTSVALDDYVADLAALAERYGITLGLTDGEPLTVEIEATGSRRFTILGTLPAGRQSSNAIVEVAETWRPAGTDGYERSIYRYELLEPQRDFRRAFHRHDDDYFARRYGVVVHERIARRPAAWRPARIFSIPRFETATERSSCSCRPGWPTHPIALCCPAWRRSEVLVEATRWWVLSRFHRLRTDAGGKSA